MPALDRALGRWSLTAFGINIVIGSAVFLTPALVAAQLSYWAPLAILFAGLVVLCIALCYAEVGSRFDATGGPYLYTLTAFGEFVAFEVGWLTWFTRVASQAAIVNGIALAIGFYAPAVNGGAPRIALILVLLLAIAWINSRGIRHSAVMVNSFALAKLAPLALFIVVGLFFVQWRHLPALPSAVQFGAGGLLLIYAFGGFETMGIPAGESSDPRKHLPFALITTLSVVILILVAVQVISMSVLPQIDRSTTPVADAALRFMGPAGALMIGVGSIVSMTGNVAGSLLAASRILFALGENGAIPTFFARVHPQSRVPAIAIWSSALCAIALALTGSFKTLALVSVVTRLVIYMSVSAATLVLRRPKFKGLVAPAQFVVPLGPTIPWIAVLLSVALLGGASAEQLVVGAAVLAVGGALFWLFRATSRRR